MDGWMGKLDMIMSRRENMRVCREGWVEGRKRERGGFAAASVLGRWPGPWSDEDMDGEKWCWERGWWCLGGWIGRFGG